MSVVIPTFNGRARIVSIVQPVLDDPATGEVVVVVDGSHDGTYELLQEWVGTEPRIRAIFQENLGDAAARQRGVEEAKFDVVVLLDDDVVAGEGLIGGHARHHGDGERRVILGYMPTRVPQPRRPGQVATVLYARDYENQCIRYEEDPSSILRHFWMGNFSLSRSVALEIGLGTSLSIRRHSDQEFGLRCRTAGIHATFDRSLSAVHTHSRTLQKFAAEARLYGDARQKLMQAHPEIAQQFDQMTDLSRPQSVIVRLLGSSRLRPVSARLAMAASSVAGRLGIWPVETYSARVLRQIEIRHGFRQSRPSV